MVLFWYTNAAGGGIMPTLKCYFQGLRCDFLSLSSNCLESAAHGPMVYIGLSTLSEAAAL